jgi:hypothetical protein
MAGTSEPTCDADFLYWHLGNGLYDKTTVLGPFHARGIRMDSGLRGLSGGDISGTMEIRMSI